MGRVAVELGLVTLTLVQQIRRLERELSTRLLQRPSNGVRPTDAWPRMLAPGPIGADARRRGCACDATRAPLRTCEDGHGAEHDRHAGLGPHERHASGVRQTDCILFSLAMARVTFARMSEAFAVQMNGFG